MERAGARGEVRSTRLRRCERAVSNRDHAELINLAAQMVRGTGMPSSHADDWRWYASTCQSQKGVILEVAERANDQCKAWAVRLRAIADRLSEQHSGEQK
jgi:hypothetical protein